MIWCAVNSARSQSPASRAMLAMNRAETELRSRSQGPERPGFFSRYHAEAYCSSLLGLGEAESRRSAIPHQAIPPQQLTAHFRVPAQLTRVPTEPRPLD